jgi:hypothetical protein
MNNKITARPYYLLLILICAGIILTAETYRSAAANPLAGSGAAQDLINLDRRLSALEQRLYTMESNISRLEQQAITNSRSTPSPTPQILRDPEVNRLQSEVETLKGRIQELECGVVHLDERTLPAGAQRRSGTSSKDPCRQTPETVVRLSMRP